MRPVMCESNHHFDADKYTVCPICGKGQKSHNEQSSTGTTVSQVIQNKSKSFLANLMPKKKQADDKVVNMNSAADNETVGMFHADKLAPVNERVDSIATDNNSPVAAAAPAKSDDQYAEINTFSTPSQGGLLMQDDEPVSDAPSEPSRPSESLSSLKSELEKVTNDNQGKTVGFFGGKASEDEVVSLADPVVGWVVAVKGLHKGQSFCIVSGKNSIGRNKDNSIVISNDNMVSRENHAWLIYEPKKREFFIQGGDGRGLVYVNDENVMTTEKLKSDDRIEIGASVFMLVPLCGENFSWDELDD